MARAASIARGVLLVFASPLMLVYAAVLVPPVLLAGGAFMAGRRLLVAMKDRPRRATLRDAGRLMTWEEMLARIPGGGSIILESLTLGWNDIDVWWTPEVVSRAGGPPALDHREAAQMLSDGTAVDTSYYRWCKERYCEPGSDADAGRSYLVRMVRSHAGMKRLYAEVERIKQEPSTEVVNCWSAMIGLGEHEVPPP